MTKVHENDAKNDATVDVALASQPHSTLGEYERLFGVDEDAYEQPTTTRKELWSYYLYYNGDNGVGPGSYSQTLFQWALNGAGYQPGSNPPKACTDSSPCVVPWAGGTKSVSSVVLIANGLCFTFMTVIFVWLGSAADYGTFGRWLLLALTVVCWALQYGMMSIRHPSQWPAAMGLYVVAYIAYGATLVFYAALFPRLARYTPHVRKAREEDLREGKINQEEYDAIESLERNHISNISTAHSNIGYLLTLVLNLSVLLPLQNNTFSNNLALCLTNSYWVVLGIWWFIFQQQRPGPKIPKGSSYTTIGFKQIWLAIREIRSLPQTFLYFLAYFLLADGLNTTGTLVSIIQNDAVSFSFLQLTYLGITQAACSITSTFGFWYIQQYFKFETKTMFLFTNSFSVLIPLWGMLGLWTNRIGYHNRWEFYFYNVIFGLFQAPYYAYAQTMISELMPRGYDNMFFALFGITNRASSIIGPNVIQAIINNTDNNWMGFPFLFAICAGSMIAICFVDIKKGREDCRKFTEQRKIDRVVAESGLDPNDMAKGKQPVGTEDVLEVPNEQVSTLIRE
ncbi:Major facilitator superfamily domain, general substrate transporter [Penicillium expansum]|uniref:Autophagy-related protein n=1 Tax=Penicillium expansum TaxID=27334 RepID=A0A0A2INZ9_PENEN|nr:Major facilitator superfamily domain, general substrate transporter [Penicillium expansum]KGO44206.1 Major facilitator superfamily domain, general substrate transporter [Penicillium expansum]KGO51061.1 Major facilitator superfamily domain, general substrate transporter [Penicillium expansum]KGO68334.1 Major facilitator superfamily domain, general substrate transporter [Penicillium expansum]